MTRIWTDGCGHGDLSRGQSGAFAAQYGAGSVTADSTIKRYGGYSYNLTANTSTGSGSYAYMIFTPTVTASELYLRVAIKRVGNTLGSFLQLLNGAAALVCDLRIAANAPYTIGIYDGTTLRVTSSPFSWNTTDWVIFEFYFKSGAAGVGRYTLKVNGGQVADFTGVTNTVAAPIASYRFQDFGYALGQSQNGGYNFTDVAINDTNGPPDNSWVGDGGLLAAQVPTGAGNYTDWTKGGVSVPANAYQAVDEIPPNNDTDFIYNSTATNKSTFTIGATPSIPTGYSISRLMLDAIGRGQTGDQVKLKIRSNGTDDDSAALNLPVGAYGHVLKEWLTDPGHAGAVWTAAYVSALEIGVETV